MWMPRDSYLLTNGERYQDNSSKMEPKRSHPSVIDMSESEFFSNKKQLIQGHSSPAFGVPQMNLFSWDKSPSLHPVPGLLNDRAFGPGPRHAINLFDRNAPLVANQNAEMGRKNFEQQYGGSSSTGMSMSHTIEDPSPCPSFAGFDHLKLNQAQVAEHRMSEPMRQSYDDGRSRLMASGSLYGNGCIPLNQTYSESAKNTILRGQDFGRGFSDFISINQSFNKEQRNFRPMKNSYSKENESFLSMGQPFEKGDDSILSMGQTYRKGDSNIMSLGPFYDNQGNETFVSISPSTEAIGSQASSGSSLSKGEANIISMAQSHDKADQTFGKGVSNMISFGGFHDETRMIQSGSIISNYNSAINATQFSQQAVSGELVDQIVDPRTNSGLNANTRIDTNPRNKEPRSIKKASPNTFPSNVKSLLSTGMFDGIPVKYYSWSREKNLKGVIRGTGYLCGCKECNYTKVLNAYEFERHANCKTKHPNNHIYFESGKTIYAVVQELKNTSQETLFDAIQNVTGSQINQKNFITWKASYQAAARELQRIYGKDEVRVPS